MESMKFISEFDEIRPITALNSRLDSCDGGLVYIYHTILHDENHPIDLRYNNTNLYIQIKQGVSYFCDRMRRNLKDTDKAAIVPSQEEQSVMIKELYDVVVYML